MKSMKYMLLLLGLWMSANSFAQQVVDVHSHIVTTDYMNALKRHHAEMEDGYPLPEWSVKAHLAFMEEAGIDCSVLTMPSPQPYFGNTEESARIIRSVNREAARAKASHPGKFLFCASLPLPDMDRSIAEAIYALDTLQADGIKLATNVRGLYLGDSKLDPLMEVLNARGTVVIIHPHVPAQRPENIFTGGRIFVYEYPAETTRAVLNMIVNNVMVRYPNIRFIVPHSGSFLPIALPRFRAALPLLVSKGLANKVDVEKNLANLYYDLAGGPTAEILEMLLSITTPDHIMYGSDFGFVPNDILIKVKQSLIQKLQANDMLRVHTEDIWGNNAKRLFKQK